MVNPITLTWWMVEGSSCAHCHHPALIGLSELTVLLLLHQQHQHGSRPCVGAVQAAMFNLLYTQHGQLARVMEASHVQTSRAKYGQPTAAFWADVAVG